MSFQAAEAYISFGNVSHTRINEMYYQRALWLLQRASHVEGYYLESHFQRYAFLDHGALNQITFMGRFLEENIFCLN